MQRRLLLYLAALLSCWVLAGSALASAYNAHPRLVVVIIIDQFRGDYLERYRDQLGPDGFRLLLDHGAYFPDCAYAYANTTTAPGHATLLTGSYSNGHGILANQWWDPQTRRQVTAVEDRNTKLLGASSGGVGASPHNLLASTLGDELKLATQGQARVFGVALKDRAAVLSAGFAGDGAYWIDKSTGAWITSSYYRNELPAWVKEFNASGRAAKYWNREWKDAAGDTLRTTAPPQSNDPAGAGFYEVVGSTPFANEYELEFARELVAREKLGTGPATDLLVISLSANDIVGHRVGPDSAENQAMSLATDRQLGEFFAFLGRQLGLGNVWIALSADHGVAPLPAFARKLHLPATNLDVDRLRAQLNSALSSRFSPGHPAEYVRMLDYPLAFLSEEAFAAVKTNEAEAERAVGEALKQAGMVSYFTRTQLAAGAVPPTALGREYAHSYSPYGGWYVMGVPAIYTVGSPSGTDHGLPYSYDRHVPLLLYGLPFQAGTYRTAAQPVDLAVTLASLLGIDAPTSASGRVLTEAIAPARGEDSGPRPAALPQTQEEPAGAGERVFPARVSVRGTAR